MRDVAVKVAVCEVLNPTLGVTEQVLAVHKIARQDRVLAILFVDEDTEAGAFYVYLGIENEPYHFVVVVRQEEGRLIASASYIEAAVRVYLTISSTSLEPSTITERVKLTPSRSCKIGEGRLPQLPRENRWYFEPQRDVPGSAAQKVAFLLDRLEPVQPTIASLHNECEVCINVCYEGYRDWMGGWHIDKTTIRRIAALGAEIDLDLYAYGKSSLPS